MKKAGLLPLAAGDDVEKKIEAIVQKEVDLLKNSARSPFLQESKLREVISLHEELMVGTPMLYRVMTRLHNWVQYEVYRSPDHPDYNTKFSA
jgi:hypothetical protein